MSRRVNRPERSWRFTVRRHNGGVTEAMLPTVVDPPMKLTCRIPSCSTCPVVSSSPGWFMRPRLGHWAKRTTGLPSNAEVTCSRLPTVHSTSCWCSRIRRSHSSVRRGSYPLFLFFGSNISAHAENRRDIFRGCEIAVGSARAGHSAQGSGHAGGGPTYAMTPSTLGGCRADDTA